MTFWQLIQGLKSGRPVTLQTANGPIRGAFVLAVAAEDGTRQSWNVTYYLEPDGREHTVHLRTVD
jgi:hypothetical protein